MCVCVCVHAQRHREREGGREKHKRRSWKDTTQQMQKPLRDLLAQRGGRKEERERERVEERSTPFTALHMWTCVSREQREQGVHTTLLTHSLTHSLPLSPLSPISSARERGREEETKRERGEKEKDTCKDLFFAMSFFLHSLSH